jgi:putative hydroxymethylpyrimidine transporter CytX
MPAKGGTKLSETPSWGIEPVPRRLRVLGLRDSLTLWASLGVSLLVLVISQFLVPALTLRDALLAIVVGAAIGCAMLAAAGLIGADARVPAMVLLRAPLGRVGSAAPTALNVLQCLGWAVFELIIIAYAAAALSDELFGWEGRWFWTLVFGAVAAAMAFMGPLGVVRRFLRRFGVWIVVASLGYLTWWALDRADLGALWNRPAEGGQTFLGGVDLVIAVTISWMPLVADYTRFSRDRRSAFWGAGLGYLVSSAWLLVLGAIIVGSQGLTDATAVPPAVAAGGLASALALLALTIDEADEAFANIYSAAISLQNVLTRVPQKLLLALAAVAATVGALAIDLREYESFLLFLGSFFVPLFGVLLADWLVAGARYTAEDVFGVRAVRPGLLAVWAGGFVLYHWLHAVEGWPGWWQSVVRHIDPVGASVGASLPSFAAALVLGAAVSAVERGVSLRGALSRT